jgi:hypothetical protein
LNTIDNLSTFLKSLFPNNLIADGGEGIDDSPDNWAPLSNEYAINGDAGASYSSMVELEATD